MRSTPKAASGKGGGFANPSAPIDGSYINILSSFLDATTDPMTSSSGLTNVDLAFLLNIPAQQLPLLRSAPSSMDVTDRRVQRNVPASEGSRTAGQSIKCIRPYHAILVRLYLRHPEYATLIPPRPSSSEVYELIQPFMRPAGQPWNNPEESRRRWFAQLFGRSLIISYKMLANDPTVQANRNNSRPVTHLQTLIMLRFAAEFRATYADFREKYLPPEEANNPLYIPQAQSWDILHERDSLTDWMDDGIYESFSYELTKRWSNWWDGKYMKTLEREARSRNLDLEDVLKTGQWKMDDEVSSFKDYPSDAMPITGADSSLLTSFRGFTGLSSSEFVWLLGISPKTFFMYRKRPNQRIDASVSILMRHLYHNPDDLDLFIRIPHDPAGLLERIQAIDPKFERKHFGVLLGAGPVAGYNMTKADSMVPAFARRAATLLARHLDTSDDIYWHLREAAEAEAKARGLSASQLWDNGTWHPSGHDDSEDDDSDQDDFGDD